MSLRAHFCFSKTFLNLKVYDIFNIHRHSSNTRRAMWVWFLVGTSRSAVRGKQCFERYENTVGKKSIRALEIFRVQKLILNATS